MQSLEELKKRYKELFVKWDKQVDDLYQTTKEIGDVELSITLRPRKGIPAGHKELPESKGSIDDEGVLKFEIPLMLAHKKNEATVLTRAEGQVKGIWEALMKYAYSQVEQVRYKSILCLVVSVVPEGKRVLDVDNRAVKHIINNISHMGIVHDDSWEYVSYMVTTRASGTRPKTEIYVIDWEKVKQNAGIISRYI